MRTMDRIRLRARSILKGGHVEQELDRELRFHLDEQVAELMQAGMSRADAEVAARRAFGGVDQIKESVRDTWHVRALRDVAQDVRYGVRVLTKSAGVHVGRRPDTRAWDRRDHRDLQRGQRRADQAAQLSRRRPHRPDPHALDEDGT